MWSCSRCDSKAEGSPGGLYAYTPEQRKLDPNIHQLNVSYPTGKADVQNLKQLADTYRDAAETAAAETSATAEPEGMAPWFSVWYCAAASKNHNLLGSNPMPSPHDGTKGKRNGGTGVRA